MVTSIAISLGTSSRRPILSPTMTVGPCYNARTTDHLNVPALLGDYPPVFANLLVNAQQTYFPRRPEQAGSRQAGVPAPARGTGSRLSYGRRDVRDDAVKVHGFMIASEARDPATLALRITVDYIFSCAIEPPRANHRNGYETSATGRAASTSPSGMIPAVPFSTSFRAAPPPSRVRCAARPMATSTPPDRPRPVQRRLQRLVPRDDQERRGLPASAEHHTDTGTALGHNDELHS
jgi:hypothetical protein